MSVMYARVHLMRLCCLLCMVLATACAHRQKRPQPVQHVLIGTIAAVNEADGFVLIDTGSSFGIPMKGQALKSFSDGRESGVLTVSPEHKPPFLIADIVTGTPQKGDQVYQ